MLRQEYPNSPRMGSFQNAVLQNVKLFLYRSGLQEDSVKQKAISDCYSLFYFFISFSSFGYFNNHCGVSFIHKVYICSVNRRKINQ